jgi:hypothetical protein
MKRFSSSLLFLPLLALAACSFGGGETVTIHLVSQDGVQVPVSVEIAADDAAQEKGLMGRESLKPDEGMLFVFPQEQQLFFWMKDTLIPLDILFFRENGEFVSMMTMPLCTTPTCPSYASAGLAKYALEVPLGFGTQHQVSPGWKLALGEWKNP